MAADDQETQEPQGPQDPLVKKYVIVTIAVAALFLFWARDATVPVYSLTMILVSMAAGFAAWFVETRRATNFGWLVSVLLYGACFIVAMIALLLALAIVGS